VIPSDSGQRTDGRLVPDESLDDIGNVRRIPGLLVLGQSSDDGYEPCPPPEIVELSAAPDVRT